MSDSNKRMMIQPLACNTRHLLLAWCRVNGFITEEGYPMNLPPEAVIAFHDEMTRHLQRTVDQCMQQLNERINERPASFFFKTSRTSE